MTRHKNRMGKVTEKEQSVRVSGNNANETMQENECRTPHMSGRERKPPPPSAHLEVVVVAIAK